MAISDRSPSLSVVLYFQQGGALAGPGSTGRAEKTQSVPTPVETPFTPEETPSVPLDLGWLAYIQGGDVWIRRLPEGEPERLTQDGLHLEPRWAPSGEWLAYREGESQVWVYDLNETHAHPLNGGRPVETFAWSPVMDQVAYVSKGELRVENAPGTATTTVVAKDLPGPDRGSGGRVGRIGWSPSGDWIAYEWRQSDPPLSQEIWVISSDGGVRGLAFEGPGRLAGWTADGRYVLFWEDLFSSSSLAADGLSLWAVPPEGGGRIQVTKIMLPYSDYLASDPSGTGRVAFVSGGGRQAWRGKDLLIGSLRQQQWLAVTPPGQTVSSPAWSWDGRWIAFSAMPGISGEGMLQGEAARQALMSRRIWIYDTADGSTEKIADDPAYRDERPLWAADGHYLLFARIDAQGRASLWLMPLEGGKAEQIVEELSPFPGWFGYYGHIEWDDLFDWWQGESAAPGGCNNLPASVPFPTPQMQATSWERLVDRSRLEGIIWADYTGQIQSPEKAIGWPIRFRFPKGWFTTGDTSMMPLAVSVQNMPPSPSGPGGEDFVKFEVLWHPQAPVQAPDEENSRCAWHTIEVAGTRGILGLRTAASGKGRIISAVFRLGERWYSATGYINLAHEDAEAMERYTAMVLEMIASFELGR